jgi:outer membrane protein assembly factor BamB
MICAAETPGGGQADELSHNLLTLEDGALYYNTNLGAVAAIGAADGRVRWTTLYTRSKKAGPDGQDKRTAHYFRDLNPCVYYRGTLLTAPADCESILALDANGGELVWESHLPDDAVHLIGVSQGNLLASGDTLWWIDAERGKVLRRWPHATPLGYGRGILMGDQVVWPTLNKLYVFDAAVSKEPSAERDPIVLSEDRAASGGNLVASGDLFLIATSDTLFAFQQQGAPPSAAGTALAQKTSGRPTKSPARAGASPAKSSEAPPQPGSGTIKNSSQPRVP